PLSISIPSFQDGSHPPLRGCPFQNGIENNAPCLLFPGPRTPASPESSPAAPDHPPKTDASEAENPASLRPQFAAHNPAETATRSAASTAPNKASARRPGRSPKTQTAPPEPAPSIFQTSPASGRIQEAVCRAMKVSKHPSCPRCRTRRLSV